MRIAILLAIGCLAATGSNAQTTGGSLRGGVVDGQRARIASAEISVRLNASSLVRTVRCDDQGNFRMDDLTPGTYRVSVDARGFADAVADVAVAVSSVRDISVTMKPLAVSQTVSAQAQGSSITAQAMDLASQVHQGIVTSQDLEELPLPARSFANI